MKVKDKRQHRKIRIRKKVNGTASVPRLAVFKSNNNIYVQSGAGIVADSNAKNEFRETENKAMALLAATQYAKNFE